MNDNHNHPRGEFVRCMGGRIVIEEVDPDHYEFQVRQESGSCAPCAASICMSRAELRELHRMLQELFPARVEREFK